MSFILYNERLDADLHIELVSPSMAADIFRLVDSNRAHLRPWFPWVDPTKSVEDTLEFIRRMQQDWAGQKGGSFMIVVKGQMVGTAGIHQMQVDNDAQIGYWLDQNQTGKGYARAAAALIANYFFEHTAQTMVSICCLPENLPSARVALSLGFTHLERRLGCHSDKTKTVDVYALTRSEWGKNPIFGKML